MRAAVYYENGGPEVLRYEEVSDPVCAPDGVVIDVEVISLEGGDTLHRGRTPPIHRLGAPDDGRLIRGGPTPFPAASSASVSSSRRRPASTRCRVYRSTGGVGAGRHGWVNLGSVTRWRISWTAGPNVAAAPSRMGLSSIPLPIGTGAEPTKR